MSEDTQRDRGVLSQADREYLRNSDDYSRQASYERERAIRKRLRNSIFDFQLLADEIDGRELREALEARDGDRPPLWAPIALLYLTTPPEATTLGPAVRLQADEGRDHRAVVLETHVDRGVEYAITEREDVSATVNTSIETTRTEDLDTLAARDLTELHPRQLQQLLQADKITEAEYGRAIKQRMKRAEGDDVGDE